MQIEIDIGTKVYGANDKVHRLFPGEAYSHFETMRDLSVVYLDYPGIGLPGPEGYRDTGGQLELLVRAERRASVLWEGNDRILVDLRRVEEEDLEGIRWSRRRRLSLEHFSTLENL